MNALDDTISAEELKRTQALFDRELRMGQPVSAATQLAYARGLTRTRNSRCLQLACQLLEALYMQETADETVRQDCLYYISIAKARQKDYEEALTYVDGILKVEPSNCQARRLREAIECQRRKDGLVGLALLGGAAALGIGVAIGIVRLAKS